jgi:hypothetical protein
VKIKLDEHLPDRLVAVLTELGHDLPGTHAGLLLVRLTRPGRNALYERVSNVFHTENVKDWAGVSWSRPNKKSV